MNHSILDRLPPFTAGESVGHGDSVIQRARQYLSECGREPMRSGAETDLAKKIAARGIVTKCAPGTHASWVVDVEWRDGTTSSCLPHRVQKMATDDPRLFMGVYPCGIVYADRWHEVAGDYRRLAFLPYNTLRLDLEGTCPEFLAAVIKADAATYEARKGQTFKTAVHGGEIILGSALTGVAES